ncbi:MAG: hypothetical protein IPN34_14735 [Planctomycetes bacterium]|nr:hypothetical protein [Planctomycetota bacterium]
MSCENSIWVVLGDPIVAAYIAISMLSEPKNKRVLGGSGDRFAFMPCTAKAVDGIWTGKVTFPDTRVTGSRVLLSVVLVADDGTLSNQLTYELEPATKQLRATTELIDVQDEGATWLIQIQEEGLRRTYRMGKETGEVVQIDKSSPEAPANDKTGNKPTEAAGLALADFAGKWASDRYELDLSNEARGSALQNLPGGGWRVTFCWIGQREGRYVLFNLQRDSPTGVIQQEWEVDLNDEKTELRMTEIGGEAGQATLRRQ